MLYMPVWNGLVEGPDLGRVVDPEQLRHHLLRAAVLRANRSSPSSRTPRTSGSTRWATANASARTPPFDWVAPDGCLCDAAAPAGSSIARATAAPSIHDWGMEFTAAGLAACKANCCSSAATPKAIARYLPKLERCANFIETRRDPKNNLFLAGPAGNLLAPSYAGWKKPDGTYGKAYLAGLSITYIAALDRLIELEKLAGAAGEAQRHYAERRDPPARACRCLTTDEGYFINSLDPDGTRHGVYGAARHGYFEASPNHDAIAFRVADDAQAGRIYERSPRFPGCGRTSFILPNYPSYDDMYEKPEGLWALRHLGQRRPLVHLRSAHDDGLLPARQVTRTPAGRCSSSHLCPPLPHGQPAHEVRQRRLSAQPADQPLYDAFGPPAAFVRGLFEYLYRADGLTFAPAHSARHHAPRAALPRSASARSGLTSTTVGSGPVTGVTVNGKTWTAFDRASIVLPYDQIPKTAAIEVAFGHATPLGFNPPPPQLSPPKVPPNDRAWLQLQPPPLAKPPHRPRRRSSNCLPTPRASIVSRNCSARKISPTLTQPPTPGSPSTPSPRPIIASRC